VGGLVQVVHVRGLVQAVAGAWQTAAYILVGRLLLTVHGTRNTDACVLLLRACVPPACSRMGPRVGGGRQQHHDSGRKQLAVLVVPMQASSHWLRICGVGPQVALTHKLVLLVDACTHNAGRPYSCCVST
jgi:hypothetical protein